MFFAKLLADLILIVHFSIVSFAVLGQLAIVIGWPLRWQGVRAAFGDRVFAGDPFAFA